jgi:hypothetical protein
MARYQRHYDRFRLPEQSQLPCEGVDIPLRGYVCVIGLGGMFVLTSENYEPGTRLALRVHAEEGTVEAKAIVRYLGPGGIGLEFVELRGQFELNLGKVLARFEASGFKA